MSISAFIKRNPLLTYFSLAFAISWGGALLVIGGPGGIPGTPEQIEKLMLLVVMALMAGPSVAGLLLTGIVYGWTGLRELLSRLFRWRVGVRWYAVALLTAPLLAAVVIFALSLFSPEFLPAIVKADNKVLLLVLSIVVGLCGGFLEELGWTGFAIPRLRMHYSTLTTGLIVGVLWGAWHFLVNFWGSGASSGGVSIALFMPLYFLIGTGQLTAFRVLMVWIYDRTGSLLLAMLMHASLIASTIFTLAPVATGMTFLTWFLVLTVALWIVVAVVTISNGRQVSKQPSGWNETA